MLLLVTSCGSGSTSAGIGGGATGRLTVLAAASLRDAFEEIGDRFERAHPGSRVSFGFAASSAVVAQVRDGAPADVVASADAGLLKDLVSEGLVGVPRSFARNHLAILVGAGNPQQVRALADLARPGLAVVLCAEQVPCGSLAGRVLAGAGVAVRPRSYEADVEAVVSRVVLGDADAGLVYITDVPATGDSAEGVPIPIPPTQDLSTEYALATVVGRPRAALAAAFVDFVLGPEAQGVLATAGFASP
ncbi:MAG: molybdate ABC transporter substrate-binding protein [Acidimicrobiales bacterium]